MREIKYRCWDKINNCWIPGSDRFVKGFFILPNGYVQIVGASEFISYAESKDQERYILCQYTGLKDKNGKEIYEGDVVMRHEQFHLGRMCQVVFQMGSFELHCSAIGAFNMEHSTEILEIIGNIYENPELLTANT